jgi:uncharacterized SAM-binding protein YcdF (DUF218 family)
VLAAIGHRILAIIGLLYLVVTITPITTWWAGKLAGPWHDPNGEVLIVPGADDDNAEVIGIGTYWRCFHATLAWRSGQSKFIVVSGSGGVAEGMRKFLMAQGIPGESILMESKANSTRENALYTRDLVAGLPGRKVLITSDYHMYRAIRAFRKAGIEAAPRPYGDALKRGLAWRERMAVFLDLMTETSKIGWYTAKGWI